MEKRGEWGVGAFGVILITLFALPFLIPSRTQEPERGVVIKCIPVFVHKSSPQGFRCIVRLESGETVTAYSAEAVSGITWVRSRSIMDRSRIYSLATDKDGS